MFSSIWESPWEWAPAEVCRSCVAGAVFWGRAQGAVSRMFPSPCWPQAIGNPGSLDKEGRSWRGGSVFVRTCGGWKEGQSGGSSPDSPCGWVKRPLKQGFPACLSHTRALYLFLGASSTSPGTQGPYSESQATSPWCRLPAPREVAESGSRTLVLRGPSRHLPLYLQGSSFSSLQWPGVSALTWEGLMGRGGGGPASVALPAGLGLMGSRPLETTGPGLQASWR